jgi:hypothetical protein
VFFCFNWSRGQKTETTSPDNPAAEGAINERGEIIEKGRLIHSQSFEWEKSGSIVNYHKDTSQLQQCKFGKCLLRLIN